MKQENFATGNWYVMTNSAGALEVETDSGQYLCIGVASDDDNCTQGPITEATCNLISAAPDMYWLILELLKDGRSGNTLNEKMNDVINKARGTEGY